MRLAAGICRLGVSRARMAGKTVVWRRLCAQGWLGKWKVCFFLRGVCAVHSRLLLGSWAPLVFRNMQCPPNAKPCQVCFDLDVCAVAATQGGVLAIVSIPPPHFASPHAIYSLASLIGLLVLPCCRCVQFGTDPWTSFCGSCALMFQLLVWAEPELAA